MIDRRTLKSEAKQNLIGQKPNVFVVAAIYVVTMSILSALAYTLSGYDRFFNYIEQILPVNPYLTYAQVEAAIPSIKPMAGFLMMTILMSRIVLDVGYMGYCLKITRHMETTVKTIFYSFTLFLRIIWLEILVYIRIVLWSFLFVIPGIIAYYRYRQALYIFLDAPDKSPFDCIGESKRLMNGHKADLLFLDISFFGWRVLDAILKIFTIIPLLSIWLAPYAGVAYSGFYTMLISKNTSDDAQG